MPEPQVVYIVDDDASTRWSLDSLFRSVGLMTSMHESSMEFLRTRPTELKGCLVLDIRMPDISGLDLQSRMSEYDIHLPIVFLTGHADIPMSVRGMKAGAVDFLTKPFREENLLNAVMQALKIDRQRQTDKADSSLLNSRFTSLSTRELEVMSAVTAGKMNKEVAGELGLSEITIKLYRRSAMQKMGARTLAELVLMSTRINPSMRGQTGFGAAS